MVCSMLGGRCCSFGLPTCTSACTCTVLLYMFRCFCMCCDNSAKILCAAAQRLCGECALEHTGGCGCIDLLHRHLQCRASAFPMCQSEQWVEPMLVWLVWLGGKWKPLSSFFFLCRIHMQSTVERWFVLLKPRRWCSFGAGQSQSEAGFSTCWFCFVLPTATLNRLLFYWLGPAGLGSSLFFFS